MSCESGSCQSEHPESSTTLLMIFSTSCQTFEQERGSRGGGGSGDNLPSNLEALGASPPAQLWTVDVVHFYLCLFLHVNLGSSKKKIVGQIRGVFSFG